MSIDNLDDKGRRIISMGGYGHGGGYLVCDGKNHFWVVPEYKAFQCLLETPVGPCPGSDICRPEMRRDAVRGKLIGEE